MKKGGNKFMTYVYLGYGVTDSNGVAKLKYDSEGQEMDHSYTGVGAGEIDVLASLDNPISSGSIVSETLSVLDALWYDETTSDTTAKYFINSQSGTSISYENSKIKITCGSANTRNMIEFRSPFSPTTFDIADLKGKTVKFSAEINGTSVPVNATIIQTVDGSSVSNTATQITSDGKITSNEAIIDNTATLVRFQLNPVNASENSTYYITKFTVWVSS